VYFKLISFNGIAPILEPRLLKEEVGVTSQNVNLERGNLNPLFTNGDYANLNASSITSYYQYKFGGTTYNLEFDDDVDVQPGPIADDAFDRLYWTGQTFPRMASSIQITTGGSGAYPRSSFRLGIEKPANTPAAAAPTGTDDGTQIRYSTSYVYTFVSAFGEEGPPSSPSNVVTKVDGQSVVVSNLSTAAAKSATNYGGSTGTKRIYRSNTGSNTTDFQFVAEVSMATTNYTDTKNNDELGEIIPSTFWIAPPDDDSSLYPNGQMKGLTAIGNGIFAGFSGKRLCFSEPFLPHAWPVAYRITLEDEIVGISMAGSVLFIGTKGTNYIAAGTDPQAMTIQKLEAAEPLLYKRSLVDMGGYCIYSGPDGLIGVENGQVTYLTQGLISPDQWRNTYVVQGAGMHEGKYVGQYSAPYQNPQAIIFDIRADVNALTTVDTLLNNLSSTNRGFYTDPDTNQLFLINKPASGNCTIESFDDSATDTNRTLVFKSKEFVLPRPSSMNFVKVEADSYAGAGVTVKVFGDGTEIFDATITASGSVFSATGSAPTSFSATQIQEPILRLPTGVHKVYQVEVTSANPIHEVCIGESIDELRSI
tara:strand:- start:1195 stop:2967 length:1773 start_codon:yes stop_codon:yes gene_type:complete